ncbi:MAG: type II toxin-antitoxin system HicB family antitoxin [Promethearchaeota archaeon]|jgi:predicted RNase H-like HicB family nuclease
MKFKIRLRKIREDLYISSCTNLEGCHVQARTEDEALDLINSAIKCYYMSFKQRHEKPTIK